MSRETVSATQEFVAFESIRVADQASLSKTITEEDVRAFAALSGDFNPLHMEEHFARETHFQRRVVHGMLVASYVSTLVGMHLPGPGALWTRQNFQWNAPVFLGDTLRITLEVTHKSEASRALTIAVKAVNQNGKAVMEGDGAVVLMETRKQAQEPPLAQRLAFVSGGAKGIGAAIVKGLAEAEAAVVINYLRDSQSANHLCDSIRSNGGRAMAVQADVNDPQAVARATEEAAARFGQPVDVLVNNAGAAFAPRPFLETAWDDFQAQLDVHLRGAFNCCQAVIPGMIAQKSGRIVNIGSTFAWNNPPAQWATLVTAKSALNALTRSLAAEFGPQGLKINMVSPGMTETDSISSVPERLRKVHAMRTPLRRLATPEDVARAVVFLCGDGGQ
ncbi:MAG: SDR family oxidoreductase, partial [Acidobacteriia bacterium]|nr:SDR family oxidoreductase [Terriglobia bacterium]